MKKIILTFCVMIMSVINSAYADVLLGNNNRCIVNTNDENKYYFYFCGKGINILGFCNQRHVDRRDDVPEYVTEERVVEVDNNKYYMCCGGDELNSGSFISVDDKTGVTYEETKTVKLTEDATCTYTITTNACGTVTNKPCTVPDTCLNGKKLKGNQCVSDCDYGYTLIGTECVLDSELDPDDRGGYGGGCPITKYQGLDENNECVRCNRDSEFFDKKKLKCVKRSDMVNADKDVMKRCWRCKNDKLFKQCIIMFQTGKPLDSALVRDCYLAEKADTSVASMSNKADTSVASMSNNVR